MDLALVLEVSLWILAFFVVAAFAASVVELRLHDSPGAAVLVAPAVVLLAAAVVEMSSWATVVQIFGSIVPPHETWSLIVLALLISAYIGRVLAWKQQKARRPLTALFAFLTAGGLAALWATVLPLPLLLHFTVTDLGTLTNASLTGAAALTAAIAARGTAHLLAAPAPASRALPSSDDDLAKEMLLISQTPVADEESKTAATPDPSPYRRPPSG